jgi:hypothetical protein
MPDNYEGEKYVILIIDGQQSDNFEAKWASLRGRPAGSKLIIWHVTSRTKLVNWAEISNQALMDNLWWN